MATGAGQSDFNTNNIAVDKTAPDGLDRQITLFGTAGQNAALDIGAILGPTNESVATTDTDTKGLNGLVKRVCQNLTTIASRLPSVIGQQIKAASLAVVLPSDQIVPINAGTLTAVIASWTSATASDSALALALTGYNSAVLTLNPTSTFTGGTLNFEASDDGGTTWYPIAGVRLDASVLESSYVIVASTKRAWQFNVAGLTNLRVRLNPAITGTGTAALRLQASAAAVDPLAAISTSVSVPLAVRLTDGASFYNAAGVKGATLTATAVSVGTTPALLLAADATRVGAVLTPMGAVSVFLGPSGVSTSIGQEFTNAKPFEDYLSTAALYGIVASGTVDVRVLKVTP